MPFYSTNNLQNPNFEIMKNKNNSNNKKTTTTTTRTKSKRLEILLFYICVPQWLSSHIWFLRYRAQWTEFFIILNHFLLFYPTNNKENQNFERMKKAHEDIIILQMCTINGNNMMYGSWDMDHGRQIFLTVWTIFCLFILSNNPENKNFEKMKNYQILSLYTYVPEIKIV